MPRLLLVVPSEGQPFVQEVFSFLLSLAVISNFIQVVTSMASSYAKILPESGSWMARLSLMDSASSITLCLEVSASVDTE